MAEQPKAIEPAIRFAETDDDVIAIHRFLLVVAMPHLWGSVDPVKSLDEIIRVTKYEAALMAIVDNMLVGTMGIIKATWWYGGDDFLTDRWDFCLPQFYGTEVQKMMMAEVDTLADDAGLKFIHNGKIRRRKNGSGFMMPRIYIPPHVNQEQGANDVLRQ